MTNGTTVHEPRRTIEALAGKLAARSRHVSVLLGAGASCAAGLPDMEALTGQVADRLKEPQRGLAKSLFEGRNLEEALTRLRRMQSVLEESETLAGLDALAARVLESAILVAIVESLTRASANRAPSEDFAQWLAGDYYTRPIEVFTVNYDLLTEEALEALAVPYFDGFVGNLRASFRPDLVEAVGTPGAMSTAFVRLWKLHGSLNWAYAPDGSVMRTGRPVATDELAAIYPSDEKYDQSRRVPFVVLQDRFRHALAEPESITLISGFSFGDQHLNEVIFDAARRYPRSEIVALCFGDVPAPLQNIALPNLSVLADKEAVLSGQRGPWQPPDSGETSDAYWSEDRFSLGDFAALAAFLRMSRGGSRLDASDVDVEQLS